MNENNNKGRGVFYGVIGVATLVVAIIGATFAYFTASATNGANVITGKMANIGFDLAVEKVVDPGAVGGRGMIPMSNTMVEAAANASCTDAAGNAVCQIYKVTVTNQSSAAVFVDGYVALAGGSGIPEDYTATTNNKTTMRWAQVFPSSGNYSTAGEQVLGTSTEKVTFSNNIGSTSDNTGFNTANILDESEDIIGNTSIGGTNYDTITKNYIRTSDHAISDGRISLTPDFNRESDLTSALVLSQNLVVNASVEYYFIVWLSENGHDQSPNATTNNPSATTNPAANNFFNGVVRFISGGGSEITATFSGYTNAVPSDTNNG